MKQTNKTVYEQVKEWLERNFEYKGRGVSLWYGSHKGTRANVKPTFKFNSENASFDYKLCDFSISIYEADNLCHARIEIYLASYCDWETCFRGVIPSVDFLRQLFNCFILPEHGLE